MWPFRKKATPAPQPWHRSDSFQRQIAYETEGAEAYLLGTAREANPYDRAKDSMGWNHWQYGWDCQQGRTDPLVDSEHGCRVVCSTALPATDQFPWRPGDMIRKSEFDRRKKEQPK